jgi:Ni/Co efflux regulator RcnB
MNQLYKILALSALAATLTGGTAFAQDHHDDRDRDRHEEHHQYVRHDDWRKGQHMRHEDWDRGARVDYRQYHLRRPPHGYEWREVDGNYVLAAVATGVIASVIVASTIH